jgi:methyltransferase (TIGR00027 family)
MIEDRPSRTAAGVARRRAVHQIWDYPRVFDDPVAVKILGHETAAEIRAAPPADLAASLTLRAFLVARSRYAEDCLALAAAHGVTQYVILGAGLDTFAYRNPFAGMRVFEVDHPATQAWKRRLIRDAGIELPKNLTFTPVNFEQDTLDQALAGASFKKDEPAFFSWLGVSTYLPRGTVLETLEWIISACRHNAVAFDYGVPRESLSVSSRQAYDALAARVLAAGEPFRSSFVMDELRRLLLEMGFADVDNLDAEEMNRRYFKDRADNLHVGGAGRLVCARGEWPGTAS